MVDTSVMTDLVDVYHWYQERYNLNRSGHNWLCYLAIPDVYGDVGHAEYIELCEMLDAEVL